MHGGHHAARPALMYSSMAMVILSRMPLNRLMRVDDVLDDRQLVRHVEQEVAGAVGELERQLDRLFHVGRQRVEQVELRRDVVGARRRRRGRSRHRRRCPPAAAVTAAARAARRLLPLAPPSSPVAPFPPPCREPPFRRQLPAVATPPRPAEIRRRRCSPRLRGGRHHGRPHPPTVAIQPALSKSETKSHLHPPRANHIAAGVKAHPDHHYI